MLTLVGNIRVQISVLVGLRVFKKHYTPTGDRDQGCGLGTKAKNKELDKIVKLNMLLRSPSVLFSEVGISGISVESNPSWSWWFGSSGVKVSSRRTGYVCVCVSVCVTC